MSQSSTIDTLDGERSNDRMSATSPSRSQNSIDLSTESMDMDESTKDLRNPPGIMADNARLRVKELKKIRKKKDSKTPKTVKKDYTKKGLPRKVFKIYSVKNKKQSKKGGGDKNIATVKKNWLKIK